VNRQSAEERYRNDPSFRALVVTIEAWYERLQFTPSEMREAAMYAACRVEQRTIRPAWVEKPINPDYEHEKAMGREP